MAEQHFARTARGDETLQEEALAREDAAHDAAEHAALHLALDIDGRIHRDHRVGLRLDRLAVAQRAFDYGKSLRI